jgi:predicted phage terminase large subunit-like protein
MTERELAKRELARRELARRDYGEYLAMTQGLGWMRTKMSVFLAARLQEFLEKKTEHAYDILLIEAPPQHGKSASVTETAPSWYLGRHPDSRVIIASYNDDFAERFCRRNKEKLKRYGQDVFGVSVGTLDRATEMELANGRGRLISRGLLSGITGNPANLLLIDDPVKNRQEADSETFRARVWDEWQNSLKTRLAAHAKIVVIMTPWHEDDFAGRLRRTEENTAVLRLPVEAEKNDPMGRAPGEPLCPELGKDAEWLREFKRSYLQDPNGGARAWTALYQCAPRAETGNLVKREWWKYYDPAEIETFAAELVSVDAAFKGGETSDFVAITVWGKRGNNYYLRDCRNKRLDFPGTLREIRAVRREYPNAKAVLIEDKANGPAVIQTLQAEMFCVPVNPLGGKISRVNAVSPAIESGHVLLPKGAGWTAEYVDQWAAFPAGAHDDMVDSSTQALSRLLRAGAAAQIETGDGTAEGLGAEAYDVYN